jgi:NNP family nitrate/nitrite transporter-like MFS transporter
MYGVLGTCLVTSFLLMSPDVSLAFHVPHRYAAAAGGSTLHASLRVGPGLFTALVCVLGIAMGIGKAAVYKHIPHYFPDRVGAVGGLVGVIGGLGGFVMPILFGALAQRTGLPTTTFMFLFGVSLVSLVWMIVVVHRIAREAAPRVAEEIDQGERLAVAGAEMATGGELVFAEHLRRWQEARRAAVAAGSE